MLITFYILLLIITLILSKKIYSSYISPFSMFLGNFFLAFAIFYSVNFIDQSISWKAISIIVISFFAFIFGTVIAALHYKQHVKTGWKKVLSHNTSTISVRNGITIEDIKVFRLFFWISIIGFIYYLYILQINIGIVRVLKEPNLLNLAYFYKDINFDSLPLYMMKLSMVNSMFILAYIMKFRCKKISIYIMLILEIIMNISVKRNILIYILILNFFVFIYYNSEKIKNSRSSRIKNRKKPTNIIIAVCVFAICGYYFAVTQKALNKEFIAQGTMMGIRLPNFIVTSITYYVANFKSFDLYLANSLTNTPVLGSTLRFLYKFLAGVHLIDYDDSFLSLQFVSVPEMFNTTLGQFYIFSEGGIIWVIVVYVMIGFIATSLYFKYQKYRSEITLMYLAFISTILLFSIREYTVITIDFWISMLVIIIMQLRCNKRKRRI